MTGNSLGFRLAAGAVLWITAALVVAGFVLSGLFRDHVEQSFERELVVQLDRLAAVSRVGPKGTLELKRVIVDPRFFDAYSGWYWQIAGPDGPIFRSRSLWDQALAVDRGTLPADTIERYATTGPNDQTLWGLRRNITLPGSQTVYQITVAADVAETRAAIEGFNTTLALSLVVLGIGLFAAVVIQVRYGLSPMRRLRRALADVRAGSTARLVGRFPDEVTPLADELNALLDHNAAVVERARTHTGNLAHALKTPLSVIANAAAESDGALASAISWTTPANGRAGRFASAWRGAANVSRSASTTTVRVSRPRRAPASSTAAAGSTRRCPATVSGWASCATWRNFTADRSAWPTRRLAVCPPRSICRRHKFTDPPAGRVSV